MSCNTGLPKILTKKNTGIIDIILFVVKYCLFLDTSSLFVNEKMPLNNEIKKNKSGGSSTEGFDLMEFFLLDDSKIRMSGGAVLGYGTALSHEEQEFKRTQELKDNMKATDELRKEQERERRFKRKDKEKESIREEVKADIESRIDEGISTDTGLRGDENIREDVFALIREGINESKTIVSNKIKGILMLIVYGSVYPAVPFFAVMAVMFGTLKYLFYKIRIF